MQCLWFNQLLSHMSSKLVSFFVQVWFGINNANFSYKYNWCNDEPITRRCSQLSMFDKCWAAYRTRLVLLDRALNSGADTIIITEDQAKDRLKPKNKYYSLHFERPDWKQHIQGTNAIVAFSISKTCFQIQLSIKGVCGFRAISRQNSPFGGCYSGESVAPRSKKKGLRKGVG